MQNYKTIRDSIKSDLRIYDPEECSNPVTSNHNNELSYYNVAVYRHTTQEIKTTSMRSTHFGDFKFTNPSHSNFSSTSMPSIVAYAPVTTPTEHAWISIGEYQLMLLCMDAFLFLYRVLEMLNLIRRKRYPHANFTGS